MTTFNLFLAVATLVFLIGGLLTFILAAVTASWQGVFLGLIALVIAVFVGNFNRILQERTMGKARYHGGL